MNATTYNIFPTHTLGQVQTFSALILSVLGIGWFFFLSSFVKIKTLWSLRRRSTTNNGEVPILETIVPITVMDVYRVLKIKTIKPVIFICAMVVIGLVLTSFEGVIVINTVHNVES